MGGALGTDLHRDDFLKPSARGEASSPSAPKEKQRLSDSGGSASLDTALAVGIGDANASAGDTFFAQERASGEDQEEIPFSEGGVPRRRRMPAEEQSRPPPMEYPSDAAIAQMSRRERIALLERADVGTPGSDARSQRSDFPAMQLCEDSPARSSEGSSSPLQTGAVLSSV